MAEETTKRVAEDVPAMERAAEPAGAVVDGDGLAADGQVGPTADQPAGPVAEQASVKKFQKELSAGIVSLVLLVLLGRAGEPLYAYQIAKRLEAASAGGLPVKQGTLYPVLRSLEGGGLVESTVEPSTSGPPRRYYSITGQGREALAAWTAVWARSRDFVDAVLEGHLG